MSKSNISKFKAMLASLSWNDLYQENNAHFADQHFLKVISLSFNECFPIGSSTRKCSQGFRKPSFTAEAAEEKE